MIKNCSNPLCSAPFRRLGRGKIFAFESRSRTASGSAAAAGIASEEVGSLYYWLCENCSLTHTLRLDAEGRITIQPVPEQTVVAIVDGGTLNHAGVA
jgi:hypothetical protein